MHIGALGRNFFHGAVTSKDSALPFQNTFQFSPANLDGAPNFGKSALLTLHTCTLSMQGYFVLLHFNCLIDCMF